MNEHLCQLITTEAEAQKLLDAATKGYLDGTQEWIWVTTKQLNQMPTLQGGRHVFIYKTLVPQASGGHPLTPLHNVMTHLHKIYASSS